MIREVGIGTGDGFAVDEVLGLEVCTVGSEDELRLGLGRCRTSLKRRKRWRDLPCVAGQDVDVAGLEHAAEIGLVGRATSQALEGCSLIAEGFQEGIWELSSVEGLFREVGDSLFDFYGIHEWEQVMYLSRD